MAFSDLQVKTAVESGIIAAHKNMAKISLFAKSYNEAASNYGYSITVPVYSLSAAGDFVGGTNDYGTGSNEVDGAVIELNKHIVKSVSITDKQLAETGIQWTKDTTTALADTLTRGVNAYVFGLINETNCPLSSEFNATAKSVIADLYAVAEENDIPVDKAVVVLNPTQYAKVLGLIGDTSIYGGDSMIKYGMIEGLYGFKGFVCSSNLLSGNVGAIVCDDAIAVANRYLAPATEGAYPTAFSMTDEDGFTLGARRFMDLGTGSDKYAMDCLFGAKVVQPSKIVRLV